jgi:hypothetical protein
MILQLLASKELKSDKRILICTPSNTALDEIMVRLEDAIKDLPSSSPSKYIKDIYIYMTLYTENYFD